MSVDKLPKEGDTIVVETERYSGEVVVTYVYPEIYAHHLYPIQCFVEDCDVHKIKEFDPQQMMRFNLKEVIGHQSSENPIILDNEQGSLFDEW